jgi:chromosome partitioning protein
MARVISFINYKGGVGKTTTTFHIGCALAMFHKKRVLLIDADPQTNLTFLCSDFAEWRDQVANFGSLEALYRGYVDQNPIQIPQIIWRKPMSHQGLEALDLIPSDITLLDIDLRLQSRTKASTTIREVAETHLTQRSILAHALEQVHSEYDYILIDCPPNLYLATQNALYSSNGYLVTLMPDHFSTIGVTFLDEKIIELLRERSLAQQILDPKANAQGELPFFLAFIKVNVTAGRQQIVAREQMALVRGKPRFSNLCFDSITEDFKDIREAADKQVPVFHNSPSSQNSSNYRRMADEFLAKFPEIMRFPREVSNKSLLDEFGNLGEEKS